VRVNINDVADEAVVYKWDAIDCCGRGGGKIKC
jgi:hypothetical protein